MEKKPLSSSKEIFVSAGLDDISRTTRCRYLKKFGKPCEAKKKPTEHNSKRKKGQLGEKLHEDGEQQSHFYG